jgi:RES domain-containing protein
MLLYRISLCKRAADISGTGAKLFGGRWNSVGVPMLYLASSRALAALEVLAHLTNIQDPESFCITVFDVPDDSIEEVEKYLLPKDWNTYPSPSSLKKMGDSFARNNKTLLLKVPSVIVEDEYNYVMNVNHPHLSKVKIVDSKPFLFDKRLH